MLFINSQVDFIIYMLLYTDGCACIEYGGIDIAFLKEAPETSNPLPTLPRRQGRRTKAEGAIGQHQSCRALDLGRLDREPPIYA